MRDEEIGRLKNKKTLLFKGGTVLTLDPQIGDFECADVLIESGKIREIRPDIAVSGDEVEVVDATHRILTPGFIDTHSHSYQGLLRGILPNGIVLPDYDEVIQKNLTAHYTPSDAYTGVLLTALGLIHAGTTGMVDLSQVSHSPEHTDANIQALQNSGMRAVFAFSRGMGAKAQYPQDINRLLARYFGSADQLLTPAMAVSTDPASFVAARSAEIRAVLHIRLRPELLIALGKYGLLRAGDEFIHCTHLNDEAWRLIKDIGGRTSHSPPLEMAMGHGMPSIQDALDHGLRPSLSGDHAATVSMDMFGIMRTAFNLQRLHVQQRQRRGEENVPPRLTCREVLEFATIEGARCANVDGKVGTLTPGKDADLLLLRTDSIDLWPLNSAYSAVVNLMNPGHVDAVFIAGRVRKWRGELVDVDMPRLLNEARIARDAVLRRANFNVAFLGRE
jgi:cytosine/adenosine deaminase-related metal-dependent hydrolase